MTSCYFVHLLKLVIGLSWGKTVILSCKDYVPFFTIENQSGNCTYTRHTQSHDLASMCNPYKSFAFPLPFDI